MRVFYLALTQKWDRPQVSFGFTRTLTFIYNGEDWFSVTNYIFTCFLRAFMCTAAARAYF